MKTIYLDFNATTPVYPEVLETMLPYYKEEYGNASGLYQVGQKARKAIEEARQTMASFIGADDPNEIVFTSGATESNNTILKGVLEPYKEKGKRIVSSAIEHSSVRTVLQQLAKQQKIDNVIVPIGKEGVTKPAQVSDSLTADTVLVSIMAVNNELGTIQPIQEISKVCRSKNILFHTDAAQAAGKIPMDGNKWGVDFLSLSAHKFGGPKGVGLLYIRKGTKLEGLIHGGTHEKNRRAGTENVPAIVGMAKAAQISAEKMNENNKKIQDLRNLLETQVTQKISHTFINGDPKTRVSNTTNICFDFTDSSSLLMALDLKGVACSNGSACATGSVEASHVLLAMGLPQHQAHASLRFSLGPSTTEQQILNTVAALSSIVPRIRETHPLWKEAVNH